MKLCSKCKRELSKEQFNRRQASMDGLSVWCRDCASAYRKTPEARARDRARLEQDRERDRERYREYGRKNHRKKTLKKYGLTEEAYELMVSSQDGRCLICVKRPDDRLVVDHCHETGRVRGLLCRTCNASLGGFQEDPRLLRKAAAYLELEGFW